MNATFQCSPRLVHFEITILEHNNIKQCFILQKNFGELNLNRFVSLQISIGHINDLIKLKLVIESDQLQMIFFRVHEADFDEKVFFSEKSRQRHSEYSITLTLVGHCK